jgi:hypothetical protein
MLLGLSSERIPFEDPSVVSMPMYVLPWLVPGCLIGLAILVAVFRANKDDLPAIVRALMMMGPRDDDSGKGPPSLPTLLPPMAHDRPPAGGVNPQGSAGGLPFYRAHPA